MTDKELIRKARLDSLQCKSAELVGVCKRENTLKGQL
jgi:hypothetical protein